MKSTLVQLQNIKVQCFAYELNPSQVAKIGSRVGFEPMSLQQLDTNTVFGIEDEAEKLSNTFANCLTASTG